MRKWCHLFSEDRETVSGALRSGRHSTLHMVSCTILFMTYLGRPTVSFQHTGYPKLWLPSTRWTTRLPSEDGDNFLHRIVAGDEKWVHHHTPKTKRAPMELKHRDWLPKKSSLLHFQQAKLWEPFIFGLATCQQSMGCIPQKKSNACKATRQHRKLLFKQGAS